MVFKDVENPTKSNGEVESVKTLLLNNFGLFLELTKKLKDIDAISLDDKKDILSNKLPGLSQPHYQRELALYKSAMQIMLQMYQIKNHQKI